MRGPSPSDAVRRGPAVSKTASRRNQGMIIDRDATPVEGSRRTPTPTPTWRRVLLIGLVVSALAVGYYLITLWQVSSAGRTDQARPVDAIVVMGAAQYDGTPSPQLAARLDHVVEMWPQGFAPLVIVTGGKQPGDRFTEAQASAQYLIERGIPESAIVLENEGSTSFESLERVAALLEARTAGAAGTASPDGASGEISGEGSGESSDPGSSSVLIVSDPYHMLRSRLIAQEVGLTAYGSSTPTSVVTGARSLERHLGEAGGVAIGRLISFERLSSLTH